MLLFVLTASLHDGEPPSTFRVARGSDLYYKVYFEDAIRKTTTTIEVRNGVDLTTQTFCLMDLNGDGYLDFRITGGVAPDREEWYKAWLFEPASRTFVLIR